jgi:hypothetical protein
MKLANKVDFPTCEGPQKAIDLLSVEIFLKKLLSSMIPYRRRTQPEYPSLCSSGRFIPSEKNQDFVDSESLIE